MVAFVTVFFFPGTL